MNALVGKKGLKQKISKIQLKMEEKKDSKPLGNEKNLETKVRGSITTALEVKCVHSKVGLIGGKNELNWLPNLLKNK